MKFIYIFLFAKTFLRDKICEKHFECRLDPKKSMAPHARTAHTHTHPHAHSHTHTHNNNSDTTTQHNNNNQQPTTHQQHTTCSGSTQQWSSTGHFLTSVNTHTNRRHVVWKHSHLQTCHTWNNQQWQSTWTVWPTFLLPDATTIRMTVTGTTQATHNTTGMSSQHGQHTTHNIMNRHNDTTWACTSRTHEQQRERG